WGVPWVVLLAAPWFVAANARTGGQLWDVFFWHHNFERGLGGSEALAVHPWWFYFPRAAVDLLPWSVVLPAAAWWYGRRLPGGDGDARAGLLWFGAIFAFLSCMSFKRADYLLPAYPGLAIFLGAVVERWLQERRGVSPAVGDLPAGLRRAALALLSAYAALWCGYSAWEEPERPYQQLAREIRRQTRRVVVFFRAESHLLAFHLGRPVETILEWENLAVWAG